MHSVRWPALCEVWQINRIENLQKVGKHEGPTFSHLWTKIHEILGECRVSCSFQCCFPIVSRFLWKIFAIKS